MNWFLLCLSAYLIGAIPIGYIIAKLKNIDIRKEGSHNIGATNVVRTLGWLYGILVLIFDVVKGVIFLYLVTPFFVEDIFFGNIIGGACIIIGNIYPIWLNFKGGKSVATTTGVFIVIFPEGLIFALAIFILVYALTKYVSAGSISAAVALLLIRLEEVIRSGDNMFSQNILALNLLIFICVALIIFKHKDNIKRLLNKKEKKLTLKR